MFDADAGWVAVLVECGDAGLVSETFRNADVARERGFALGDNH